MNIGMEITNNLAVNMLAFRLLVHSVLLLTKSAGAAIRISAPFIFSLFIGFMLFRENSLTVFYDPGVDPFVRSAGKMIGFIILIMVSSVWTAVAWHRYVLLSEVPNKVLPVLNAKRLLTYFWKGLLIGLILLIPGFILSLLVGSVFFSMMSSQFILIELLMAVFVILPLTWVFYRLSPILPASALDQNMPLSEAWSGTRPASGTILLVSAILIVFTNLINWVFLSLIGGSFILGVIVVFILQWLQLMIAVSVLTTLYGYLIEKRDLLA